jgi:hypothetical protein
MPGINLATTSVSLNVLAIKNGVPYLTILQPVIVITYVVLIVVLFLIYALLFLSISNLFFGLLNFEKSLCKVNSV